MFVLRLIKVEIKLALRAIHLKNGSPLDAPDCCKFDVTVSDHLEFLNLNYV